MTRESLIRQAFVQQAKWCEQLGSPFTAQLMKAAGLCLDRSTMSGRTILDWKGRPGALGDAVPLRLAGAFHALVRRGRSPALVRFYPPNPMPAVPVLAGALAIAIREADTEIDDWLGHPLQTNEVARSACLYAGVKVVASETGLPLALFEIGSSAGLNLLMDRYRYRFGTADMGDPASPVVIAPDWHGRLPPAVEPQILRRRGCDTCSLEVTEATHRERLVAYVWADQWDRLARIEAAIGLAITDPPVVDAADAADWVEKVMADDHPTAAARVLFHSITFQYLSEGTRLRIVRCMEKAARRARPDAPLAWLAFEPHGTASPKLSLRLWPGGGKRVLASGDSHARRVNWFG